MKKIFLIILLSVPLLAGGWETDINKVMMDAKRNNRHILLNFTGSDWCKWCKKLDAEVFNDPKFKAFANANLITVKLDFPKYKQLSEKLTTQNNTLAMKYGVSGFPTIIILNPQGYALAKLGYESGGAQNFVQKLKVLINK